MAPLAAVTEWEFGSGTPVSSYPLEGAIESVAFSIPNKKGYDASKAEVLAVLEAKWGKVNEKDPVDPKNMIFSVADPHRAPRGPQHVERSTLGAGAEGQEGALAHREAR